MFVGRQNLRPSKRQPRVRVAREHLSKFSLDGDHELSSEDEISSYIFLDRRRRFHASREHNNSVEPTRGPPAYDEIDFSDDEHIATLAERPEFKSGLLQAPYEDVPLPTTLGVIPAPIAQYLRPYQVQGARFMHEAFYHQTGCILGDDMGLGKTIQVIAFLTAAFGKRGDERDRKLMRKVRQHNSAWYPRVLIVCPGTLISNWESELDTWGWWQVYVFHGPKLQKDDAIKAAKSGSLEIMITTYSTYRSNASAINAVDWDCVIADECHQIKERKSEISRAMNAINALCRIGLTGTAIQNSYDELWNLLNWAVPGKFGPLKLWVQKVARPLKIGQAHGASISELAEARKLATMLKENLLPRVFLRRMKRELAAQLPRKTDLVVFCPLTAVQRSAYENYLDGDTIQLLKYSRELCDCRSQKTRGTCCYKVDSEGRSWTYSLFPFVFPDGAAHSFMAGLPDSRCIMNVRKLSNHLASWIPQAGDALDKREKDLDMLKLIFPDDWEKYYSREPLLNYTDTNLCGKWLVLQKLLRYWSHNNDKVLIFSHNIPILRMLHAMFRATSYNVSYLDGEMSLVDRTEAVKHFNNDQNQFVFLISTRAGGVGLNITSANKVVIFDPSWNPSHDLQAQDRAFRIGQRRDVEVFRLVSGGTIEEIVYARQIYKQQQANIAYDASSERRFFEGVANDKHRQGELFGIKNLFTLQNENLVLKDIVNRANIAESRVGVSVIGIDVEEPELDSSIDENVAISQIAEQMKSGKLQMFDEPKAWPNPIQAILSEAGVQYSHENADVLRSSRIEEELGRRATVTVASGDTKQASRVFADGEHLTSGRYRFKPPKEVRYRQFKALSSIHDESSLESFALVVEGLSQNERTDLLDRFYKLRFMSLLCRPDADQESR